MALSHADFEVMASTLGRGAGKGAFYTGERVIDAGEVLGVYQGLRRRNHDTHSDYCFCIESDPEVCIDGAGSQHWSAYMNDAGVQHRNNVTFAGDGDIVAMHAIKPGCELFVSYGRDYWRSRSLQRT